MSRARNYRGLRFTLDLHKKQPRYSVEGEGLPGLSPCADIRARTCLTSPRAWLAHRAARWSIWVIRPDNAGHWWYRESRSSALGTVTNERCLSAVKRRTKERQFCAHIGTHNPLLFRWCNINGVCVICFALHLWGSWRVPRGMSSFADLMERFSIARRPDVDDCLISKVHRHFDDDHVHGNRKGGPTGLQKCGIADRPIESPRSISALVKVRPYYNPEHSFSMSYDRTVRVPSFI